jgi:hypothetical protein
MCALYCDVLTIAFSSWVIPVQPRGFAAIASAFEKFGKAWTVYKRRLDGDAAELQARVLDKNNRLAGAADHLSHVGGSCSSRTRVAALPGGRRSHGDSEILK